jgi:hypothetical protein
VLPRRGDSIGIGEEGGSNPALAWREGDGGSSPSPSGPAIRGETTVGGTLSCVLLGALVKKKNR